MMGMGLGTRLSECHTYPNTCPVYVRIQLHVPIQGSCRVVKRFVDSSDQIRNGRKHKSLPGGKISKIHTDRSS